MSVPDQLRRCRAERKLTQAEAAERCGYSLPSWSQWERGVAMPMPASLAAITASLGVVWSPETYATARARPNRWNSPDDILRLIDRTAGPDCCWPWTGTIGRKGYGEVNFQGVRKQRAHRVVYELLIGPIPVGLDLDHLCHAADAACPGGDDCPHRRCVNPAHLEPVTKRENVLRGKVPSANRERCKAGLHDISTATAIYVDSDGYERCAECRRESKRRYQRRRRG